MNSSINHDPYYPIPKRTYNTDLHNNYAPISKQLRDSLSTSTPHPLARYLDEIPTYENIGFTDLMARQFVDARKRYGKHIERDFIKLDKYQADSKFDHDVVTANGSNSSGLVTANGSNSSGLVTANGSTNVTERYQPKSGSVIFGNISKKEEFQKRNADDTYMDQVYIQSLESRLIAVLRYIEKNDTYSHWRENWKALEDVMLQSDFSFSRLAIGHPDVAFTMAKGKDTRFRIRDKNGKYLPLNVYQYVLLHEAAHCANFKSYGHGKDFQDILSLLCIAAYEIGFIRIANISTSYYLSDGQPVLSRKDIKEEIYHGIDLLEQHNPTMLSHYELLRDHIGRQ